MFYRQVKRFRFFGLACGTLIFLLIGTIPVRLAIAQIQAPQPQAILTLGGGIEREYFTAQFAQTHPNLEIWVSSGIPPDASQAIFRAFSIPDERVHIDHRAVDTVTNFTTLLPEFKRRQIRHLYMITSTYHMRRAKAIATLILGSVGIAFTPVTVPSGNPPESWFHILRDVVRAIVWIFTGRTGASLNPDLEARL